MERVSMKKAFKNDATIFGFLISSGIMLLIGVIMLFLPDQVGKLTPMILLGMGFLSLVVLGIRVLALKTFVSNGKVYKAMIAKRYVYRSTRYIKFEYEVDGVFYKKTNSLFANKNSKDFYKGDEIDILICDTNPKRALIKDIYFD